MKRIGIISIFIFLTNLSYAQNDRVQNVHSLKVTIIGLTYAYEQSISQKSTVNFELMLAGEFGSSFIGGDYWLITPIMRVEPRYYYNYLKRAEKNKKTINNSANYLSLSADYQFGTSFGSNAHALHAFSLIPKWGLKRTIGNHFIFEFAAGIGAYTSEIEMWKPTLGLDLKFGYSF
jgi:hypothetical protein